MGSLEKTTAEIVRELQQGRDWEENFQHLFERYHGQLYCFFRGKGMPAEDSRCLTQEIFISVYRGLPNLQKEDQFESWLYKIALNVYRDEIDRRQTLKRSADHISLDEALRHSEDRSPAALRVNDPEANPMEAMLEKEKREKLYQALQALPEQMRGCVQLRVVNDLSYQDIAGVMGLSINTVKAHLHQARKALKEKLSPYFTHEVERLDTEDR